jgi:DNA adenine methylase
MTSLLRYPGGKVKVARDLLRYIPEDQALFVEPFCGGAAVALAVAERDPNTMIYLSDIDPQIAYLWWAVSDGHADALAVRYQEWTAIMERNRKRGYVNRKAVEEFRRLQGLTGADPMEMAWAALFLNRTSFSGKEFTTPIGGWKQENRTARNQIDAEWRSDHVVESLYACEKLLEGRCRVTCQSWYETIMEHTRGAFVYLDPPYYQRGNTMFRYGFTTDDHIKLAVVLRKYKNPWLLSYDDCPEVRHMYHWAKLRSLMVTYSAHKQLVRGNAKRTKELVITPG